MVVVHVHQKDHVTIPVNVNGELGLNLETVRILIKPVPNEVIRLVVFKDQQAVESVSVNH